MSETINRAVREILDKCAALEVENARLTADVADLDAIAKMTQEERKLEVDDLHRLLTEKSEQYVAERKEVERLREKVAKLESETGGQRYYVRC